MNDAELTELDRLGACGKLKERHGRKGQETEYYEYAPAQQPRVVVQRVGAQWLVGMIHTDKTWQIERYVDHLDVAKALALRIATRVFAETLSVEEARRIYSTMVR